MSATCCYTAVLSKVFLIYWDLLLKVFTKGDEALQTNSRSVQKYLEAQRPSFSQKG